jgi:hypothetical protein
MPKGRTGINKTFVKNPGKTLAGGLTAAATAA